MPCATRIRLPTCVPHMSLNRKMASVLRSAPVKLTLLPVPRSVLDWIHERLSKESYGIYIQLDGMQTSRYRQGLL